MTIQVNRCTYVTWLYRVTQSLGAKRVRSDDDNNAFDDEDGNKDGKLESNSYAPVKW